MRTARTRVIDIKPQNRIKTVTKLANGELQVEQHSGAVITIKADDPMFQQFAIYSVLAEL